MIKFLVIFFFCGGVTINHMHKEKKFTHRLMLNRRNRHPSALVYCLETNRRPFLVWFWSILTIRQSRPLFPIWHCSDSIACVPSNALRRVQVMSLEIRTSGSDKWRASHSVNESDIFNTKILILPRLLFIYCKPALTVTHLYNTVFLFPMRVQWPFAQISTVAVDTHK